MNLHASRLLTWLLHYPLQRDADLALALGVSIATICRHLGRMTAAGLVESVTPSGRTKGERLSYLTRAGLIAIASEQGADPVRLARFWGADEAGLLRLLPRLNTLVLMQDIINGLVVQAPQIFATHGRPAHLTWLWRRDWQHRFVARGKPMTCHADAVLLFEHLGAGVEGSQGEYTALFLLVDGGLTGWADRKVIEQRLEQFLRYRESAERTASYRQIPPLVVLVQHPHQQERWQNAAREVATRLRLDPPAGAVVCVLLHQQIVSAWSLPWQHLAAAAPCRLQDLLTPLPLAAVPPDLFSPEPVSALTTSPDRSQSRNVHGKRARWSSQSEHRSSFLEKHPLGWLSHRLTQRQRALLHLLYSTPLLSTEEVAACSHLTVSTAARTLAALLAEGCLERLDTDCGRRWCLGQGGLRWVAAALQVPLSHVEVRNGEQGGVQRGVVESLRTIRHTAGMYGFLAALHQAARKHGHQVRWWETGPWCERRYHDQGAWHLLRPDAAFEYVGGTRSIRAWLEWDEGTMTSGALAAKMQSYVRYVRSREWAKETHPLPILLLVTKEPGQERRIQSLTGPLAGIGLQMFLTTATRLADQGPLAPIWLPAHLAPSAPAAVRQSWVVARPP